MTPDQYLASRDPKAIIPPVLNCCAPLNCGMVMPLSGGIEGLGTKEEVTPGGERLAVKGAGSGGLSLCVAR